MKTTVTVVVLAFAVGAAAALAARAVPLHAAPALGTPGQCAAYGGLPQDWGKARTAGMAHVRGGEYVPGTTLGYPDERPAGAVRVAGFWIDRTEVTNAQFAAFVQATGYVTDAERAGEAVVFHKPTGAELQSRPYAWWSMVRGADWRHPTGPASSLAGRDNQPVTIVTQADARAYAAWLGHDLPTEDEWEYAAKAGASGPALETMPNDAKGVPTANYWQGIFPTLNSAKDGFDGLAPVGCYSANAFGLFDMIANAWEWTGDAYTGPRQSHANGDTAYVAAQSHGRAEPPVAQMAVIKGGSFLCAPDFCVRYRASAREPAERDLPTSHIGFRTVLRGG
ncbi:formylglycine-generating enzyme family protein [Cupriavidus agavae]|uniref:Formylglycine-generating enzyme required for sulfatase activity n=1 Tax=Cupriavidus agavae TaxID=1001822 RepID=A0A4Q7RSD1_9BURK|nr:formylglycine-generating enzyme family protein [Cupriavidus agavae]RZT36601.1 formylglycine-generating enzyme required for sulfatase activity [Cupriavidus agavae]